MRQPIRGQDGHIGFWIDIKVTTLGRDPIRNICAKFGIDPCSRSWEVENVSANQRPGRPCFDN